MIYVPLVQCMSSCFVNQLEFDMQALLGLKTNTGCFYLDCRSLGKGIGVEFHVIMLYQGLLLKLLAMLRNILSGKLMYLEEKDGPACLIL